MPFGIEVLRDRCPGLQSLNLDLGGPNDIIRRRRTQLLVPVMEHLSQLTCLQNLAITNSLWDRATPHFCDGRSALPIGNYLEPIGLLRGKLLSLDLSGNELGSLSISTEVLVNVLISLPGLHQLNLADNDLFHHRSILQLVPAFIAFTNLKSLSMQNNRSDHNNYGNRGNAGQLLEQVASFDNGSRMLARLEHLNLSGCGLWKHAAAPLAIALDHMTSLTKLLLDDNGLLSHCEDNYYGPNSRGIIHALAAGMANGLILSMENNHPSARFNELLPSGIHDHMLMARF